MGNKTPEITFDEIDLSFGEEPNPTIDLYNKLEIGNQKPVFEKEATYPNKKRYLSQSGKIEMAKVVINPNVRVETRETLYYDQYGWKEVRLIHEKQKVSMMGFNQMNESFKLTIMDGENLATVDLEKLTGGLSKNAFYEDLADMTKAQEQKFAKGVSEGMNVKTEELSPEVVAGKTCQVTRVNTYLQVDTITMVTTMYQWKHIPLMSESKGMGSVIKEQAFKVEEGNVPQKLFYLPEDVKLSKFSMDEIPGLDALKNRNK
ncbi:MAG: hypothetical protein KDE26_17765 [Bacteroidetes bacterium]|nr:hypothetical protein [Bacteroidota bacterium]